METMERPTVLIVDDCVAERDLYQIALEPEFNILTAARGSQAISLAARHHPDAIVLDVMMPEIDGWETCARLKSQRETIDIPVVFLTGNGDHDLSRHAKAVWASAVLRKPCPAETLRSAILAAIEQLG
jgi:putative two-component system response regulator